MLTLYISSICRKVMETDSSYFGIGMNVTFFAPTVKCHFHSNINSLFLRDLSKYFLLKCVTGSESGEN